MRLVELQEGTRCWKGYERKGFKTMFGKRVPNCVKREDRYLVVDKFNDPVKLFDNEEEAVSYFHANYEDLNTEASYEDLSQDQLNQIEQWYKKWSRVEGGDGGSLPDDWFSTADHGDLSDGVAKADKDAGLDYTEDDLPVTDAFLDELAKIFGVESISLMDENYASMTKDAVKFMLGRDRKLGQMESSHSGLRAWFGKGKKGGAGGGGWDRYNTKGERIGKCGDRKKGEGKPKCLSKARAASLRASGGKKAIAAAVRRKRSKDKNPNRKGKAINVANKPRKKK